MWLRSFSVGTLGPSLCSRGRARAASGMAGSPVSVERDPVVRYEYIPGEAGCPCVLSQESSSLMLAVARATQLSAAP